MILQFIQNNWFLFILLFLIIGMLCLDPIRRRTSGIQSVSALQLPQLMNHENTVIVDVGDNNDFAKGHIANAINIPVGQLKMNLARLEKHRKKESTIVLVCRSGQLAPRGAQVLKKENFSKLYTLTGGMNAWVKENLPVQR